MICRPHQNFDTQNIEIDDFIKIQGFSRAISKFKGIQGRFQNSRVFKALNLSFKNLRVFKGRGNPVHRQYHHIENIGCANMKNFKNCHGQDSETFY